MASVPVDLTVLRRAVSAAQAILTESTATMIIDGKAGTFTVQAYRTAPAVLKLSVDRLMAALGVVGSMEQAHKEYSVAKTSSSNTPGSDSSKQQVFDLQVVPAVTREARRRGLNPVNYITQLSLESGYGKSTPLRENGQPTFNYGGIKWDAAKTPEKAFAKTKEQTKSGVEYSINDSFAVFTSADDFAKQYFNYLFDGPSSYRYKRGYKGSLGIQEAKTPYEFGTALQIGGYATDVKYGEKFASVATSVARKYSLA